MPISYVSPSRFRSAMLSARMIMPSKWKAGLHQYSLTEYAQMRTFLSSHGWAGFAIKPDGDLVNVFSIRPRYGQELIAKAVEEGAKKLDCYDGPLVGIYSKAGFVEVRREPFNLGLGPSVLAKDRPDVVYMEYQG